MARGPARGFSSVCTGLYSFSAYERGERTMIAGVLLRVGNTRRGCAWHGWTQFKNATRCHQKQ